MTNVTDRLCEFVIGASPSPDALEMMRLSLFDWAACAIAGVPEPVSRILHDKAVQQGGAAHATLAGGGQAPCSVAALVNGTTSHALDYDTPISRILGIQASP